MRIRRALLFMPGDSERKIHKAAALGIDSIVMDLEDGVAWSQKQAARAATAQALQALDFGGSERAVRLNPAPSDLAEADLQATIAARPDAYVLPKVETPAHLLWLAAQLDHFEARFGWPSQGIRILALIETARGVVNVHEIAQASPRLDALLFGAEDLIGDIGGVRTPSNREVLYARSKVAIVAAAFGLQAIDQIFVDLHDQARLQAECQEALELGYRGKMAIHPTQAALIQAAFSPTPAQMAAAAQLVAAYEAHQACGAGVFTLDGKVVEAPMVKAAQQLLSRVDSNQ